MCEPEFINHFYYDVNGEEVEDEHIFTRVNMEKEVRWT